MRVSIQPKPKTGLEVCIVTFVAILDVIVSIQPKPKTGLEERKETYTKNKTNCFNPAEAEDGFRSFLELKTKLVMLSFNPAEAEDGFRS